MEYFRIRGRKKTLIRAARRTHAGDYRRVRNNNVEGPGVFLRIPNENTANITVGGAGGCFSAKNARLFTTFRSLSEIHARP